MIGNLLEGCHVTQARWLANLFSHSSLELDIVMVTYRLMNFILFVNTITFPPGRLSLSVRPGVPFINNYALVGIHTKDVTYVRRMPTLTFCTLTFWYHKKRLTWDNATQTKERYL